MRIDDNYQSEIFANLILAALFGLPFLAAVLVGVICGNPAGGLIYGYLTLLVQSVFCSITVGVIGSIRELHARLIPNND